jgi:hypothetical protein
MAGQRHLITVDDSAAEWALLIEIAGRLPPQSWTLVGGMMVQVHAIRAGIEPTRFTSDVDVLVSFDARISDVAAPLLDAGFRAHTPNGAGPFHRFRRAEDVIDIMVTNTSGRARWTGRGVLRMPGGRQVQERCDTYVIRASGTSVELVVPDALGAIIVKAGAYSADHRDRSRHLDDLVVLLAAAERSAFAHVTLSRGDRQHLRPAITRLIEEHSAPWMRLRARDAQFARARLSRLVALIGKQ